MERPCIIAVDWGSTAKNRVAAEATPTSNGYQLERLYEVDDTLRLVEDVSKRGQECSVLSVFDFPIGVPIHAARQIGVTHFRSLLDGIKLGYWREFYQPSDDPNPTRPFYPRGSPGGTKQSKLSNAFGAKSIDDLKRHCERVSNASCMFWAVGPNQVAKACASGMTEVVIPLLSVHGASLWPFDGSMQDLLQANGVTIAEMYPSALYAKLSIGRSFGKSDPVKRREVCSQVLTKLPTLGVSLSAEIESKMRDGFGSDDEFDAVISACALASASLPEIPHGLDPQVRRIEGWILGVGDAR